MAKHFHLYKEMRLAPLNFGPLCSRAVARRCVSSHSVLSERTHARFILKRCLYEKPLFSEVIPQRVAHHILEKSYSTNTVGAENTYTTKSVENRADELTVIFQLRTFLCKLEWDELLSSDKLVKDSFRSRNKKDNKFKANFDVLVLEKCMEYKNWRLADSYFEYLELKEKEPSILSLAHHLELCAEKIDDCGEGKVLEAYERLSARAKVFDALLSVKACLSLTRTTKWKEAFNHIPMIERMLPSIPAKVYNAIISAAFRNGEFDTGWQYLHAMYGNEKLVDPVLHSKTIIDYIRSCPSNRNKESMADILFKKFSQYEIFPQVPAAKEIVTFFQEDVGWSARYVKIFNDGICPACNYGLRFAEIDEESFTKLREEFVSRVIWNSNIYKSTDPEEWSRFKTFVEEEGPFTTVVDGLNVVYCCRKQNNKIRLKRLREVVTRVKLSNRKESILVIGRKHMEKWSPTEWTPIKRRAKVFFLNNISKDDGFFLYAALCSGLGTKFITSDLLRNHLYRLRDSSLKKTFLMWQRSHQIFVVDYNSELHLVLPPKFVTTPQKDGEMAWHIPYDDGSAREAHEVPHTWICLHADKQKCSFHSRDIISEVAFECLKEENSEAGFVNPQNFGLGSSNTNIDVIKLTGVIPGSDKRNESKMLGIKFGKYENERKTINQHGSQKSESKMLGIKYGKFQSESDSNISVKPYGDTRTVPKDYEFPSSIFKVRPNAESSNTSSQTKFGESVGARKKRITKFGESVGARKKMKEKMMKIIKSKNY